MTGETLTLLVVSVALALAIAAIGCVHLYNLGWRINPFVRAYWWPHALGVALYWESRKWAYYDLSFETSTTLREEHGIRLILDLAIINITCNLCLERHA